MFYEVDEIERKLQCVACKNRIDVPKLLPCGYTLCNKCANDITTKRTTQVDFTCSICNSKHLIPEHGFPIQRLVQELLDLKSIKVYRSGVYEKADCILKQFQLNLYNFNNLIQKSDVYLHDYCDLVRGKVASLSEKRIAEIAVLRDKLINEINSYEESFLKKNIIDVSKFDGLVKNYEKCLLEWNLYLKRAETSEIFVEKMLQEAQLLNCEMLIELKNFEKLVFNNFKIFVVDSNIVFNTDVVGVVELRAL
jgi:hypothetical protein